MTPELFEITTRRVSLALQLLDDVDSAAVRNAAVRLAGLSQVPVTKEDGFYVFTDVAPDSYDVEIESAGYQSATHSVTLPLAGGELVVDVPGENETMLSVSSLDRTNETISFAPMNFFRPIPAGTRVISSRRIATLTQPLEGAGVTLAQLDDIGTTADPTRIRERDIQRFVLPRALRLRPGPYYAFGDRLRRLTGVVRDSVTGVPIEGALVELTRVNAVNIAFENVGTTPPNTVRVHFIGTTAATKRVVGTRGQVQSVTDERGGYAFYFPARAELAVNAITVRVTRTGYNPVAPVNVDLTLRNDTSRPFSMVPI